MIIPIPYGKGFVDLDVPGEPTILEPRPVNALGDERSSFHDAVRNPIWSRPLEEIISSRDRVVIVTSDNTRPLPNQRIIPWLLAELPHVPADNFTVLIGTGSHRACGTGEIESMFGSALTRELRIVNHDAFDPSRLGTAGKIETGDEILLNREYLDADKRITLGFIEPHFFAGFSGGPKAIMPGIAGIGNIMQFHSAAMINDPRSTWGVLEGNPVYGMASGAACLMRPDFSINVTLGPRHDITGFFCGDVLEAHRAGAAFAREASMSACDGPFDIVITSNSGHPLDRNFYQTVKGICAAGEIIKDGGSILCLSRCGDGIPRDGGFHEILKSGGSPGNLLAMLRDPSFSRIEAWQARKLAAVLDRAEVHLHSSLSREDAESALCIHTGDPAATLEHLLKKHGNPRVAVLRYGPISIPYIHEKEK